VSKDRIYSNPQDIGRFTFDERVASVFSDMIQRSVPGYGMMLEMIGIISREFVQPDSRCYDLGCSLGASTLAIATNLPCDNIRVIGVDNSAAMVERCREAIATAKLEHSIEIRCEDVCTTSIDNASLVAMNFTLQFIAPEKRATLLKKIHGGLNPGGVFILSEKITDPDPAQDELLIKLYHDFKAERGYSQLEIAQKRDALEDVLNPDSLATHQKRLEAAGFSCATPWFQCFNFTSILAIK
jgi:tRNA (cmo5U34)-methyltransferase